MKKGIFKNLFLTLVVAMFVVSFASVVMSVETQESTTIKESVTTIKGTVISINTDTGKVLIKSESGDVLTLTAGSNIDLAMYNESDEVTVLTTYDGVIKTINKMNQPN